MSNLEKRITKLESDINQYDSLKNDQKTVTSYNNLKTELDACLGLLKTYETDLNNVAVLSSPKTEETFNNYLSKIETLKNTKITSFESRLQIYTELAALTKWCKEYVDGLGINKKLNI